MDETSRNDWQQCKNTTKLHYRYRVVQNVRIQVEILYFLHDWPTQLIKFQKCLLHFGGMLTRKCWALMSYANNLDGIAFASRNIISFHFGIEWFHRRTFA